MMTRSVSVRPEVIARSSPKRAPRPKPARFENSEERQRMLLAGLDCLPGQGDLFQTDGEEDSNGG